MRGARSFVLAALALGLVACAEAPGDAGPAPLEPTPAAQVPEASFDAVALFRDFAPAGAWLAAPTLGTPLGATRVGAFLTLDADDAPVPALEARGLDADGAPVGPWRPLEVSWREGRMVVARVDLEDVALAAELRVAAADAGRVGMLTWSAVVPEPAQELPEVAPRSAALRSEIAAMGVRSREDWGARATRCSSRDPSKYRMAIHHTVTPADSDPATRLRGIQAFHQDTRGWCDIGYHFLVSLDGQLWEGRSIEFLGTHVGGQNSGNIGISFIGCFHSSSCSSWPPNEPPNVMVENVAGLVAGLADLYGIAISSTSVKGHRDHEGATTSCPGDYLHRRLDDIRSGSVEPPDFAAEYVDQSFPLARDPFELAPGETSAGYLELRNVGGATWRPGETYLATTEPRDGASALAGPDWVAPNRPATVDGEVPPGATGRFAFTIQAPSTPGEYPQYFGLVQEGTAWFSDPGQGGPPDDQLQVRVTVLDVPPVEPDPGPGELDAGTTPGPDAGAMPMDDAGAPPMGVDAGLPSGGDAGPRVFVERRTIRGSCSAGGAGGGGTLLVGLALLVLRRRR